MPLISGQSVPPEPVTSPPGSWLTRGEVMPVPEAGSSVAEPMKTVMGGQYRPPTLYQTGSSGTHAAGPIPRPPPAQELSTHLPRTGLFRRPLAPAVLAANYGKRS